MSRQEDYMMRCLALAKKGTNKVAPNPLVGAVLVFEDRIIGEGWHQEYGQAHAEVNCLNSVVLQDRKFIPKSQLYVNLEPCNHFGRTPPCCDLIIKERVSEVFVGCIDTSAAVSGKGIKHLREEGIKVNEDILEKECQYLNRRFFTVHEKNRPFVLLKWAETLDGFMGRADHSKYQISDWLEMREVHKMRYEEDAVLVGYQTAFFDNPKLNNRYWYSGKQPLRVLVDFDNKLPPEHYLMDQQQDTVIFNCHKDEVKGRTIWKKLEGREDFPKQIVQNLKGVNSLIVEGGAKTLQAFIDCDIWDEAHQWVNSEKTLGHGLRAPLLKNASIIKEEKWGSDCQRLYKLR